MKTKKITIWIPAYRPFIMGGNCRAPVAAVVDGEPVNLGKGIKGYIVRTPNGGVAIAEAKSGGIVGNCLAQVQGDVHDAKPGVMRKQIADAIKTAKTADVIDADDFWTYVKGATNRKRQHA